jgi:hypothetical protein
MRVDFIFSLCRFSSCPFLIVALAISIASSHAQDVAVPSEIPAPVQIELGSVGERLIPAAGGLVMLVNHEQAGKLSVIDVVERKLRGTIETFGPDSLIAGGAEVAIVVNKTTGACQVWSLSDLTINMEVMLKVDLPLKFIAMGSDSSGPLVLVEDHDATNKTFSNLQILSGDTFEPVIRKLIVDSRTVNGLRQRSRIRGIAVSRDGVKVILPGNVVLQIVDQVAFVVTEGNVNGRPRPNGFRYGNEAYFIHGEHLLNTMDSTWRKPSTLPFLFASGKQDRNHQASALYFAGIKEPIRRLVDLGIEASFTERDQEQAPIEERLEIVPQAGAIVTLSKTVVAIASFDLDQLESTFEHDEIGFSGAAQLHATVGNEFSCQPEFRTNQMPLQYSLDDAWGHPKGMSMDESGQVTWQVPESARDTLVMFAVAAERADGRSQVRHYRIFCRGPASDYVNLPFHNPVRPVRPTVLAITPPPALAPVPPEPRPKQGWRPSSDQIFGAVFVLAVSLLVPSAWVLTKKHGRTMASIGMNRDVWRDIGSLALVVGVVLSIVVAGTLGTLLVNLESARADTEVARADPENSRGRYENSRSTRIPRLTPEARANWVHSDAQTAVADAYRNSIIPASVGVGLTLAGLVLRFGVARKKVNESSQTVQITSRSDSSEKPKLLLEPVCTS